MQSPSPVEFDFNSGRASPCGSSPSTPKGFGNYYFSAPTSPVRPQSIYREYDDFFVAGNNYARGETSTSALPYDYYSYSPRIEPKSPLYGEMYDKDGQIRAMKPSPYGRSASKNGVQSIKSLLLSPSSTKTHHKKSLWSAFSPKRKKDHSDDHYEITGNKTETRTKKQGKEQKRGRSSGLSKTSRAERRSARSHSPVRKSKYPWEEEEQNSEAKNTKQLSSKGSKKWRLKDLFLFRSASDGRAFDKDPLKKYSYFHRKQHEVAKSTATSTHVSTEGSDNSPITVRKGPISAHELHYTVNKAMSEDMKKKSFLPYKQGIMGRLAINPTVHALAHGFGSLV